MSFVHFFPLLLVVTYKVDTAEWNGSCPAVCSCLYEPYGSDGTERRSAHCSLPDRNKLASVLNELPNDVESLSLQHSGLQSISELCCLEQLRHLDLSQNHLSALITYDSFDQVQSLDLRSNQLQLLHREEFIAFPNVETLNLEANKIDTVHAEAFRLPLLKQLYLGHNEIKYVNERIFRFTPSLETLSLTGNRLTAIHARNFFYLPLLQLLDLSHNQVEFLHSEAFEPLRNLEDISLANNNLTEIPLTGLRRLKKLRRFNLGGNKLVRLEPLALSNLSVEELYLSQSVDLHLVLNSAFANLLNLTVVNLSASRQLSFLSPLTFINTPTLLELNLDGTNVTSVPHQILRLSSLRKLSLQNVPLNCDCFAREIALSRLNESDIRHLLMPPNPICFHLGTTWKILDFLHSTDLSKGKCLPKIHPWYNEMITANVGETQTLYCTATAPFNYTIKWRLPNGQSLTNGTNTTEYTVTDESLTIALVTQKHQGNYECSVGIGDSKAFRRVQLVVISPDNSIYPLVVGANYVTLEWNHSSKFSDQNLDHFRILYKETGETRSEFEQIRYLNHVWRRYSVSKLVPETNYTFCLVYQRFNVSLYRNCTTVVTRDSSFLSLGVSLNYSLVLVVSGLTSFIFAVFVVRCVYRRFYIWQREKQQSRVQGSISAQGFFTSFDSLRSLESAGGPITAVTYENRANIDCTSDLGEDDRMLRETIQVEIITDNNSMQMRPMPNGTNYKPQPATTKATVEPPALSIADVAV